MFNNKGIAAAPKIIQYAVVVIKLYALNVDNLNTKGKIVGE